VSQELKNPDGEQITRGRVGGEGGTGRVPPNGKFLSVYTHFEAILACIRTYYVVMIVLYYQVVTQLFPKNYLNLFTEVN
jgi:hypothetical protein